MSETLTMLWDIHPYSLVVEGVFVGIEATEGRIALRPGAAIICIHRSIVLVTKGETRTGLALTICFGTLTADGFLFITLELPLTASQAVWRSVDSLRCMSRCRQTYQPVRDLMPRGCSRMAIACRVP